MELIVISGLSGAGKSQAASILEDLGYFVVDNLPAQLIPKFAELCMSGQAQFDRAALVSDIRGGQSFDGLFDALTQLTAMGCGHKLLYMEAEPATIIKRYKETRHLHPLLRSGGSLDEAVHQERAILEPVRRRADFIVDTTTFTNAKLRGELQRLFGTGEPGQAMGVNVTSFGFKYGIPIEADLVFDVRFLPNPYYVAELRNKTGLDEEVFEFVFRDRKTKEFMAKLEDLVAFLLPQYVEEGKSALVIAVGCTGGKHRSVAVTRALAEFIRQKGYDATENHRDMTRVR